MKKNKLKKRQRKIRFIRAGIQLLFFICAPSLFSTAFAGIKSIFTAIGQGKIVAWNSFLDVTAVLLLITCLFGRHFCGYACAFGTLGDALYEGSSWIWKNVFRKKKKPGYPEQVVHVLQKVKYVLLTGILLLCVTGVYSRLSGTSPWDVFSMLLSGHFPGASYKIGTILLILIMVGMCTQERFFCQFLCPMGAVFALMPVAPGALFKRKRESCAKKCTLCKKRCPAHLDIDGDTIMSGECICCHACLGICPAGNVYAGILDQKPEEEKKLEKEGSAA